MIVSRPPLLVSQNSKLVLLNFNVWKCEVEAWIVGMKSQYSLTSSGKVNSSGGGGRLFCLFGLQDLVVGNALFFPGSFSMGRCQ